ncbi:helix-turn-helix domain-containing protein [Pseudonocardia sp. Cha107L01]|uniref:helix-turn-helix domain-containing protein n=1 Tax=Pseudonocardia sp. Cha107L01 TaxID=3457576 RepID=UPI00403EED57
MQPHEAGLVDDGHPRRVAGLRREEVAQLANISVDCLARLEQGRVTSASAGVLQALGAALLAEVNVMALAHGPAHVGHRGRIGSGRLRESEGRRCHSLLSQCVPGERRQKRMRYPPPSMRQA